MQYKYYLRRMTFAEYMIKLYHIRPLLPNQDVLLFTKPELIEIMRPMMKYNNSNTFWTQKQSTSLSYREAIRRIMQATQQLFRYHFSDPEQTDRFMVRHSSVSIDIHIHTRLSGNQVLKNLILAYIIVTIMLIAYIEYNIFFRRY